MRRPNGSIRSHNNPVWDNRYRQLDHGMYMGMVIERKTPGLSLAYTMGSEQTYTVRLIGGERDGQFIADCRISRTMGGRQNFEDMTLKASEIPTFIDFGPEFNVTTPLGLEGGDYVYVQFLNGDTMLPVITGFAKHPLDPQSEIPTTIPIGQHKVNQFNGVKTEISELGDYTFTKALGTYSPVGFDLFNPLVPLVNEFTPVPGSEEYIKFEVDGTLQQVNFSTLLGMGASFNILLDTIDINTTTTAGISIAGLTDSIDLKTVAGASIAMSGITDSVAINTLVGTSVTVDGLTDSITLAATAGASVSISGLTDQIDLTTTSGAAISIGPTAGSMSLPTGTTLELSLTGAKLTDPLGAGFSVENGMIALGGPAAELVTLVAQAFQALATQTAPGFGAPTSTIATFAQLSAQIALIQKGSV